MLRSLRASSSFRATNSSLRIASFSDSLFFSRSGMRVKSEPAWLQDSDNTMFSPTILLTCQDLESVTVSLLIPPCMDKQTLKKNFDSATWDCACIWLLIEPKTKRHSNNLANNSIYISISLDHSPCTRLTSASRRRPRTWGKTTDHFLR